LLILLPFIILPSNAIAKRKNLVELPFKPTKTAHMLIFFILTMIIGALVIVFVILAASAAFLTAVTPSIKIAYLSIYC